MRVALIAERKSTPDRRVVLTPVQCAEAMHFFPGLEVVVERSEVRCFSAEEYDGAGIAVVDDVSGCDVLLGVKEVPIANLVAGKTYFFFSHTIKGQPHNMPLLRAILNKNITLVDFECLTDEHGERVIAFGRWAGVVGTHNGLKAFGKRTGAIDFPRVFSFVDFDELTSFYKTIKLPAIKIVMTGTGRVAHGVVEVLEALHVRHVDHEAFVEDDFDTPVFTQLGSDKLYRRVSDGGFSRREFHDNPRLYASAFRPFFSSDLLINAMYWDPRAPRLFTLEDMLLPEFRIKTIADITCDVGGSVPATIRASTIARPVYGFDPITQSEVEPYQPHSIDIMAIDNLPNELPRDASKSFGELFLTNVLPELVKGGSRMIHDATITTGGVLKEHYGYLGNYLKG